MVCLTDRRGISIIDPELCRFNHGRNVPLPVSYTSSDSFDCAWQAAQELHHRAFPLPGDQPQYAPTRRIDLQHIKLELRLDFDRQAMAGIATLTACSLAERLTQIELDSAGLAIASATVNGAPVSYEIADERLILQLPRPASWDETLLIAIVYSAQPRRGLYFVAPDEHYPAKQRHAWTQNQDVNAHAWFPCYTLPGDKATSEILATVPAGMFALSNGRLMETRDNGDGSTTFHWRQDVPHSAYLVTLAAGPFSEWMQHWNDLPVPAYVLPGREADARRAFGQTPDMIAFFSEKIGVAYPYAQYAQVCVQDFIMGGMENTSATTLTETFLPDERIMPEWTGTRLIAHELAHQWFGDLLTCRDWSHGWLNEGFATYFDALYHEHALGTDEFRYMMRQNASAYLAEDSGRYRRPIVERTYHRPLDIFDAHLYPKGAWALHMIRTQLGDSAWWRAINQYVTRRREGTVITSDLQRTIEDVTGVNLDKFFDQWIFTGGHPELKLEWSWDGENSIGRLTVRQTQQVDALTPIFDLPVDVLLETASEVRRVRVRIDAAEQSFHFPLSEPPKRVRFDPEDALLKTIDFPRPHAMLAYQLEHDPDVSGRIEAAAELGKKTDRQSVEALAAALQRETFWGVAAEIARALGAARTPSARDALLAALDHADSRVRRAVVEHLASFKHDAKIGEEVAARLQRGDPSPLVEAELAKTLGIIRADGAFDLLLQALERSSWNDVVRARALDGLGALEDARGLPLLIDWSQYGRPEPARIAAANALAALAKVEQHRRAAVERLAELLRDPAMRVRVTAARALGTIGDRAGLAALQAATERDLHPSVVRAAREAARNIREGSAQSNEMAELRAELEKLAAENRELKERVDSIEQRRNANQRQDEQ
jgi:aminopeptidase N